jgi:RNA polymerase sigma-70 factor (ECF subfamily)
VVDDRARAEFEELYRHAYPRVVAQVTLLTGSRAAAEDAVQEAFARAWNRWGRLAGYDQPQAWVRRVAMNLAVSRWRSLRREQLLAAPASYAASPIDRAADWVDLQAALLRLPVRQRRAVVLSAVVGLSTDEIAAEMSVAPATVRSWLSRTRRAVADPIEEVGS